MRVLLDFYHPWANHAGLFLARADGLYADRGLEPIFECGDPFRGDGLAHLARGECDLALTYPNRLWAARERGERAHSLAAINRRPMEALFWRGGRPPRLDDLRGRAVAFRRSPRLEAMLPWLLRGAGIDPAEVETIALEHDEPTPVGIEEGRYDFGFGALGTWEALIPPGSDWIGIDELGVPSYPAQLIAGREVDASWGPGFVAATREGYARAAADPGRAAAVMHAAAPYFPFTLMFRSVETLADYWGVGDGWGDCNAGACREYGRLLVEWGLLQRHPDLVGCGMER